MSKALLIFLIAALPALAMAADERPNTTNTDPSLYVKHPPSSDGRPLLAHCRNMAVHVDGHMVIRRQCVTPAQ